MSEDVAPGASRPYMPDYDLQDADRGTGLLPWSWARERLVRSHDYWLATRWPDGRPHVMPVWGVWREGMLWFSTGRRSRKARNLAADPRCAVTTCDAQEPVVVEGAAERVDDLPTITAFTAWVNEKYESDIEVEFFARHATFRVRPARAFALTESDFTGSPTRWVF
jgi:PPOX class probable F420-dependent enzyme